MLVMFIQFVCRENWHEAMVEPMLNEGYVLYVEVTYHVYSCLYFQNEKTHEQHDYHSLTFFNSMDMCGSSRWLAYTWGGGGQYRSSRSCPRNECIFDTSTQLVWLTQIKLRTRKMLRTRRMSGCWKGVECEDVALLEGCWVTRSSFATAAQGLGYIYTCISSLHVDMVLHGLY